MPLTQQGDRFQQLEGDGARAIDQNGNAVTVFVTHEAIQDHDWDRCWETASAKYDAGETAMVGDTPRVNVRTSDFPNA